MHKDGKWAKQIISLQDSEGKWGCFHSLSQFYNAPITTEQALRRLERLGYSMEDECIQKAVSYMNDCLTGKNTTPDRREKVHDWDVFMSLLLATWIRRFTNDNPNANRVAGQWAEIISTAFKSGIYDHKEYVSAYKRILKPNGGRIINFFNFYPISLLRDCLDKRIEEAFIDLVMKNSTGIYYIYESQITVLPQTFESKKTSRYLSVIELLAKYKYTKYKFQFVLDWLNDNRNENGKWDMGKSVNDKMYFPLSDDWRKQETREADCTERITKLVNELMT